MEKVTIKQIWNKMYFKTVISRNPSRFQIKMDSSYCSLSDAVAAMVRRRLDEQKRAEHALLNLFKASLAEAVAMPPLLFQLNKIFL